MSRRRLRPAITGIGVAMAGLLVSGAALPASSPATDRKEARGPEEARAPEEVGGPEGSRGSEERGRPKPPPTASPAMGAYLDYGPEGVQRIARMQKWLGGTELRVGHSYLPGDLWSNIEGSPGFLEAWATWRKARADRIFALNVPMLENTERRTTDSGVRRELRKGAQGDYDGHFRTLAERLVRLGVPDTVIVLGWEMNGVTYAHRCGPDPGAWKKYWNRIVTAMRAVPGQKFRFDFAPNRGRDDVPWTECYPGDDVVDIIGMDSYDQSAGQKFADQVNEPYGLQQHVDFAAAHGKVISYPEWGLFSNGDNPEYVRGMLQWMDTYKPLYNTITDYCPHGVWMCEKNPKASRVFRSMLYGRTPAPAPAPECTPLNLGSWVESWLGGKVCLPFHQLKHQRELRRS
ncbi:glycoside hydrolase family 26 protein [Streptomyces sp. NPDC088116]|uniref:glycoside hydrolase family 26 protein n=1 Tax=Streptomyces sp. NPDC088116 TaxID=3365825 RepID=UPI0037FC465C